MPDRQLKVVFVGDAGDAVKAARDMDAALANVETRQKSVSAATIATGVALGGVLLAGAKQAAGAAKQLVTSYAEAGSQIHDLAQRTGFSTEALSEWKYAADQSGSSIEGLEVGIKKMNQTVVAANDGAKTQVETLAAIGVKVSDLRGLQPEQVFERITTGLAGVDDEATQAALATELFGRQGTQLLPILKDGAANVTMLRDQAKALGITFSQDDANAADAMGDAMHRMDQAIEGVKLQIGRELLPVLEPMVEQFGTWIQQNGDQFAHDVADGISSAADMAKNLVTELQNLVNLGPIKVLIDMATSINGKQQSEALIGAGAGYVVGGPLGAAATGGAGMLGAWLDNHIPKPGELIDAGLAAAGAGADGGQEFAYEKARIAARLAGISTEAGSGGGYGEGDAALPADWSPRSAPAAAAKDLGLGSKQIHTQGGGGGAAKQDPLVEAWKRIHEQMAKEESDVYVKAGAEQLAIRQQHDDAQIQEVRAMAERIHQVLGVDMADATTNAFTAIRDQEQALADDRIALAEKATKALQAQMELEAKLADKRMADAYDLTTKLWGANPGASAGSAAGLQALAQAAAHGITGSIDASGAFTATPGQLPRLAISSDLKIDGG